MEGPKSVEVKRLQVIDILNSVLLEEGKPAKLDPADRSHAKEILAKVEAMPEFDKKRGGFNPPEKEPAIRARLLELDAKRKDEKNPEEIEKINTAFDAAQRELDEAIAEYFDKQLLVAWDKAERRHIWKVYRKELLGKCTLQRESFILGIAKVLGKSGDAQDALDEAIEEQNKADKEEDTPEPVKPELVR